MTDISQTQPSEEEQPSVIGIDPRAVVRTRQAATGNTIRVLTALHREIRTLSEPIEGEIREQQLDDTTNTGTGSHDEKDDSIDAPSPSASRRWLPTLLLSSLCSCNGERVGLRDWLKRLTVRSPYNYKIEAYPAQDESDYYFISRYRRDAMESSGWYLCDCGRWVAKPLVMPYRVRVRDFKSERAADEFVRRLRHGVPQRYELLMVLAAAVGGALPYVIVEIVRAL